METTETLQVRQSDKDVTLTAAQFSRVHAGDYLGDGMSHGTFWTWTRVRVIANDTRAKVMVVRFPNGEYSAATWAEFDSIFVKWSKVSDRPAEPITGETWAA